MFQSFSSNDLLRFRELREKDLKILYTGSYQLPQTVSYLAEMMNDNGSINLQFVNRKKIVRPAEILCKLFTQNNINHVIEGDKDEDKVYIMLELGALFK